MPIIPPANLLLFLVERRFSNPRGRMPTDEESRRKIKAYEAELSEMPEGDFIALAVEEMAKAAAELKLRTELQERIYFFHQVDVSADYSHWCRKDLWTADEATALTLGKAPEYVDWEGVKEYLQVSLFAQEYARLRDLIYRSIAAGQLCEPIFPGSYIAWARRKGIQIPSEFEAAMAASNVSIGDWRALYEDAQRQLDDLSAKHQALLERTGKLEAQPDTRSTGELQTRERSSLFKLIIAMAIGGYGYNPSAARNDAIASITEDLDKHGLSLDGNTIRKWLRMAADSELPGGDA
jgi:hypothetical protein